MTGESSAYDLVLLGGHVIDPANDIDAVMAIGISDGVIATVQPHISASCAKTSVDVSGLYVTPGLIDLHVHVYSQSPICVHPDPLAARSGVTTLVDAGTAGRETFETFKTEVIDQVRTRVLAFLNIAGCGMTNREQDLTQMDPVAAAEMIQQYREHIVGLKSAHYWGPGFEPIDFAVQAGRMTQTPIMVDFWSKPTATYEDLILKHLRPGDMHTHFYARQFPLLDQAGAVQEYVWKARERGVLFDVGHGAGSFWWRIAAPAVEQGFVPDSISTDLHRNSALLPAATMDVSMSKFLNLGMSFQDVVKRSTLHPAQQIQRPDLGTLSVGACADVAVFAVREGEFGYIDSGGARLAGAQRIECQMTVRAGQVLWDLNGISCPDWREAGEYDYVGRDPLPRHDWPA